MKAQEREPLPGIPELAKYLGMSEQGIYDQRHRGVAPGALGFKIGKHVRFRWEDIDQFVADQQTSAPPPERA